MANIKVSGLPTATSFEDDDYVMIVQSNTSKKITKRNMYGNYIYSTNEIKIGKWIDGTPIYRKVIDIGYLPSSSTRITAHNIQNISSIVNIYGTAVRDSDKDTLPIPYVTFNVNNNGGIAVYANNTSIVLTTTTDRSAYYGYVVLEYTKTTD